MYVCRSVYGRSQCSYRIDQLEHLFTTPLIYLIAKQMQSIDMYQMDGRYTSLQSVTLPLHRKARVLLYLHFTRTINTKNKNKMIFFCICVLVLQKVTHTESAIVNINIQKYSTSTISGNFQKFSFDKQLVIHAQEHITIYSIIKNLNYQELITLKTSPCKV